MMSTSNVNSTAFHNMLVKQLREQFMLDETILGVIANTPRAMFVPEAFKALAYADMPIPLGQHQKMMTPNEEARMLHSLLTKPADHVLEIGTGSGYITALLAQLANRIISVDIFTDFTHHAKKICHTVGLTNIDFITADAHTGYGEYSAFDVICVTASLPLLPNALVQQLKVGGRLFVLLGTAPAITASVITRTDEKHFAQEKLFETNLPEMINAIKPSAFIF